MIGRDILRGLLNLWVVVGAVSVALMLLSSTLLLLWLTRPEHTAEGLVTVEVNVIPVPTASQVLNTPPPKLDLTPTLPVPPSPLPGILAMGAYVQVSGTGGDGLRLRTLPSLESDVLFLAIESEVLQVRDGPHQEDGYTWWYLVAPYDETRYGWAVSNYLVVVQNP